MLKEEVPKDEEEEIGMNHVSVKADMNGQIPDQGMNHVSVKADMNGQIPDQGMNSVSVKADMNGQIPDQGMNHVSVKADMNGQIPDQGLYIYRKSGYFCCRLIFSDFAGQIDSQKYFS